jgi:hypothetical protein
MRRTWTILVALVALLAFAPTVSADEFPVNSVADVGGVCTLEQCTIRQALGSAAQTPVADVVTIPAATYTLTLGALAVGTDVTLRGAGARTTTIVAAANARVLDIGAVTARIESVTLSGGTATDAAGFHGGNLRSQGGNVLLDRVRVTGGSASSGGGLANNNGQMTIRDSLIDHNSALQGGGDGGGIINFGGDGGNAAALTLQNSTIALNAARLGGALITRDNPQNAVTLENVTVARNAATDRGVGGIAFGATPGGVSARASIVAGNTAQGLPSNCGGGSTPVSNGANVESGSECGFAQAGDVRGADALLGEQLVDADGETDVLPPSPLSPAVNLDASACAATDQRGSARPKGPRCDAGAVEIDYEIRIDSGPSGPLAATSAAFTFSSTSAAAVGFDCALDAPGGPSAVFEPCPGTAGTASYAGLQQGEHTFRVRALTDGGTPLGEAPRTFVVDTIAPAVTITSGPPAVIRETNAVFEFTSSDPQSRFECTHIFPDGARSTISCESGWHPYDLFEGVHRFEIAAIDPAGNVGTTSRTVRVDPAPPDPVIPTRSGAAAFTFASAEPDATFECRIEGLTEFAPCTSPVAFDLGPGDYVFALRTVDAAGNRSEAVTSAFSIAAATPPAASPTPVATVLPIATPTPTPRPQAGETVVARAVSGRILVKRPGGSGFIELRGTDGIPVGSEVNAKNGRVRLTIEPGDGKPLQQAVFYAGIFTLSQAGETLDLTLSEPLASCKRKRASAAQSKAKARKLWGDGKGKFRTRGRYSSATVRGTIWLVQDSCDGTLTRVRQGVVSVRDRKRTVLVRAGRSYLAKARR